jgi:hypothetical protein
VSQVALAPISVSPCDAATSQLGSDAHPRCTKSDTLTIRDLGTVELDTVTFEPPTGYEVELSVHGKTATQAVTLAIGGGGCSTTKCIDSKPRAAHLRKLQSNTGETAFGVEIESTVVLTHTWEHGGSTTIESRRIACIARGDDFDCALVTVGGPWSDCAALGWTGTTMRVRCTDTIQLGLSRDSDTIGIPYADVQAIEHMFTAAYLMIWADRNRCPRLVDDIGAFLDANKDTIALAHAIETQRGALPPSIEQYLVPRVNSMRNELGCLSDPKVVDAIGRVLKI